jgi:hypothetical protein
VLSIEGPDSASCPTPPAKHLMGLREFAGVPLRFCPPIRVIFDERVADAEMTSPPTAEPEHGGPTYVESRRCVHGGVRTPHSFFAPLPSLNVQPPRGSHAVLISLLLLFWHHSVVRIPLVS